MNLAPNAGFAIRWMDYTPVEGSRGFFIIQIHERKSKTSKTFVRRYLVHNFVGPDETVRCFRMKKSLFGKKGEDREDFYNVLIGPSPHCDCKGWSAHGNCCHVEALAILPIPLPDGMGREAAPSPKRTRRKRQ